MFNAVKQYNKARSRRQSQLSHKLLSLFVNLSTALLIESCGSWSDINSQSAFFGLG